MSESSILSLSTNAAGSEVVVFKGSKFEFTKDGQLLVSSDKNVQVLSAANGDIAQAQQELYVGKTMEDGTVVCAVDWEMNIAKAVPAGVFGGESCHYKMEEKIVRKANSGKGLHGHTDWRLGTDTELEKDVKKNWNKLTSPKLQGSAAPEFWGATVRTVGNVASVWCGANSEGLYLYRYVGDSLPVPLIRTFPARS
jgi:hypothetical protein